MLLAMLDHNVQINGHNVESGTVLSLLCNNLWRTTKDGDWVLLIDQPLIMWDLIQEGKARVLLDINE